MNQLQIIEQKLVNFDGNEIMGVRTNDEKIRIGVRWVCEGIGLTVDQAKRQMKNIQSDLVVSQGVSNLTLPTNGGMQEVLTIELDFLPLWLAKISITPTMQKDMPEVANNLVNYQLKAKDVLAEAFVKQVRPKTQTELIAMIAQDNAEKEKRLTVVEERQDAIHDILSLDFNDWRNEVNRMLNAIAMKLGGGDYFKEIRNQSYQLLENRASCNLDIRLNNRRQKMSLRGSSKTAINNLSKLEVIAEDKKLISVYITVIKEMAVKYQLDHTRYNLGGRANV